MSVQQIAEYHVHANWPVQEIAEAFNLTPGQVHMALAYYFDHQAEIEQAIKHKRDDVDKIYKEQRDFAGTDDVLHAVMTPAAAARVFGVTDRTVRDAIEAGKIDALKSGGTWLIRRADAERRWGKRQ